MFILTTHVLLPLLTSVPNLFRLTVQADSFSRIGVKVWNKIPQELRNLYNVKQILSSILGLQDSYIHVDISEIIKYVKSW